uniref:Major histocompatibility complex, class II, DM alpha n=1 Tax=Aotus nancymaae TaxID=37293 RepID=A0A2K5CX09_AOTNA
MGHEQNQGAALLQMLPLLWLLPHSWAIPEGFPIAEVFTLKPLEFGKPNTLVCFVSNLFPPMLTVSWQHHSVPVEEVGPTFVSAVDGLSFQAFSYLNVTPEPSDIFSCVVTHEIDRYTAIAYWVPQNALPSDLLENVLCGVAFGLGVLGIIVGIVLIIYFRKPCSGSISSGEARYRGACVHMSGLFCGKWGGAHIAILRLLGVGACIQQHGGTSSQLGTQLHTHSYGSQEWL